MFHLRMFVDANYDHNQLNIFINDKKQKGIFYNDVLLTEKNDLKIVDYYLVQ